MAKRELLELDHKVFGTVLVTGARIADSGHVFLCRNYKGRPGPKSWRKTLLVSSFDHSPQLLDAIWHKLYSEWFKQVNRRNERDHQVDAERARRERPRSAYVGGLS